MKRKVYCCTYMRWHDGLDWVYWYPVSHQSSPETKHTFHHHVRILEAIIFPLSVSHIILEKSPTFNWLIKLYVLPLLHWGRTKRKTDRTTLGVKTYLGTTLMWWKTTTNIINNHTHVGYINMPVSDRLCMCVYVVMCLHANKYTSPP